MIIKNRKTCSIKFDQIDDQISYYSSKVRNMINRTKKNNIHSYISLDKIDFLDFQKIYLDLMLTKKADKELFFTDSYFNQLYKLIQKNGFLSVVKNNKSEILGAGVFLFGKKFCHYHLSATNQKYKSPGVNNLLIHQAIIEAKKKKIAVIARGPLASGLLTGEINKDTKFAENDHRNYNIKGEAFDVGDTFSGVNFEKGLEAVKKLKEILPEGFTLSQLALKWILLQDGITVTIPGAINENQVNENANVSEMKDIYSLIPQIKDIYDKYIKEDVHNKWL